MLSQTSPHPSFFSGRGDHEELPQNLVLPGFHKIRATFRVRGFVYAHDDGAACARGASAQRRLILPEVEEVGGGFHYLHSSVLSGAEDVSGYVSAGNHVSIVTYDGEAVLEWAQGC